LKTTLNYPYMHWTDSSESALRAKAANINSTQPLGTFWARTTHGAKPAGTVNMQKAQNKALKIVVGAGILILTIWGGVVGLTAILDYYGFGPNTQTEQDRIEQNLRRLEGQAVINYSNQTQTNKED